MHATRTNREHDQRIQGREAQTRAWTAPIPMPPTFNIHDGTRQRLEWDTRETINNRLWSDTMTAGPKMVMSSMLAAHPSRGAETMNTVSSRKDDRPYHGEIQYYPDAKGLERPRLPPKSLFDNPWIAGYDIEAGDIARELRSSVKEDNRHLTEDVSARMAGRTFEHQWIPETVTHAIANRKIEASELLRPSQDDYRRSYLTQTTQSPERRDD